MDQADSEQLVVGQDARDRRRRLLKWLSIGLAVFSVIGVSIAIAYPLAKRRPATRFDFPTTVTINDTRVHLVFGEGKGNMVTEAIIETGEVEHVTVQIIESYVSDRANNDNKDKVLDPVVKFDNVRSDTGTLVRYTVASKYHPEDSAQFKVLISFPRLFDGELTIDGTTLDIDTWNLGNANLRLLHFSTDIGNITFHNGSRTDLGYGIYQPTMRTKALYANIRQRGSILLNSPMVAAEYSRDFHAHLETREGDITFEALTNMFSSTPHGEPWYPTEPTETLHYFNLVAHKGNIDFDIRFDGVYIGPWYIGITRIDAKADSGSIQGNLRIGWLVNAFVDMQATHGCDLRLSNNFLGLLSLISSTGNAIVVPSPHNTDVFTDLRHPQRGLKYIIKYMDGEPYYVDTLSLKTLNGDAGVYFEDYVFGDDGYGNVSTIRH
ncbi:hypothetical protein BGX30_001163 [Mortierella sp. GBA39]|nr:hypothetical protein BGX30_001163 [Mortierella sp. GBA39]